MDPYTYLERDLSGFAGDGILDHHGVEISINTLNLELRQKAVAAKYCVKIGIFKYVCLEDNMVAIRIGDQDYTIAIFPSRNLRDEYLDFMKTVVEQRRVVEVKFLAMINVGDIEDRPIDMSDLQYSLRDVDISLTGVHSG